MIFTTALTYVGTPFVHQGRVPGHALDCIGTYVCSAKQNNRPLKDFFAYGKEANPKLLEQRLQEEFITIPFEEREEDDLLLFWIFRKLLPQHIGIYGIYNGEESFVHAYSRINGGSVIVTKLTDRWIKKIHSCHRLK